MVVAGQPKTTSEYIQATSRVGRDVARPGLVVTVLNLHKPRDRSHYERFTAWHECFYRHVEAMSLTPFSAPALERGFAGALLAMARHTDGALQPPDGVMDVEAHPAAAEAAHRDPQPPRGPRAPRASTPAATRPWWRRCVSAGGASWTVGLPWCVRAARGPARAAGRPTTATARASRCSSRVLDPEAPPPGTDDARFAAPTSMRDVEATAHIWVERRALSRKAVVG
jgi:hypothetical protein